VDQIKEFGQTPSQLFDRPHPQRRARGGLGGRGVPTATPMIRGVRSGSDTALGPRDTTPAHGPSAAAGGGTFGRFGRLTNKLPFKQIMSAVKGGMGLRRGDSGLEESGEFALSGCTPAIAVYLPRLGSMLNTVLPCAKTAVMELTLRSRNPF
jgi:hypothetical protein